MDMSFLTKLLADPNFLQGMGNAGASLSRGDSFGEAFNPAELINQIAMQKAGAEQGKQFRDMLAAAMGNKNELDQPALDPNGQTVDSSIGGFMSNLKPTPIGTPGADSVIRKQTADGETVTVKVPSQRNLNTYGTNVPAESIPATPVQSPAAQKMGGGTDNSPFFQALFS